MAKSLEQIIEAFDMMWGNYPEPVRLIDRSFLIVAANEAYIKTGGQINVNCNVGDPAMHKGCQAIAALNSGETKTMTAEIGGKQWDTYWVPVKGSDDYYIHFTNGMNAFIEMMKNMNPENMQ